MLQYREGCLWLLKYRDWEESGHEKDHPESYSTCCGVGLRKVVNAL